MYEKALSVAKAIGTVEVFSGKTKCSVPVAAEQIQKRQPRHSSVSNENMSGLTLKI